MWMGSVAAFGGWRYQVVSTGTVGVARTAAYLHNLSRPSPKPHQSLMSQSYRPFRLAAALGIALVASNASAQHLVVSHDEWVTGGGFAMNEKQFVSNTMSWFNAGAGSNVLMYTSNSHIVNTVFQNYLEGLGMTVTADANALSFVGYDVVLVSGNPTQNIAGLTTYVQSGGNVMYFGGTGNGGAVGEATYSNPFLNAFGFQFANSYSSPVSNVNTSAFASQGPFGGSLFAGVNQVYADQGNAISLSAPVSGWTSQLFTEPGGLGVFGAATASQVSVVPEPSTVALLIAGLLATVPFARRRKTR